MTGVSVSAINATSPYGVVASTTTDSSGNFTLSVPANASVYLHLTYTGYVNKNTRIITLSSSSAFGNINMLTEADAISMVHGGGQCSSATTWSDSCIQSMSWLAFGTKIGSGNTNAAGVTISVSPSGPTIGYNNGSGVYSGSSTLTNTGGLPPAAGYSSTSAVYSFTATNGGTPKGPVDMRLVPGESSGHTFSGF
jgi:hypothetical protein